MIKFDEKRNMLFFIFFLFSSNFGLASEKNQLKEERNVSARRVRCMWHEHKVFVAADFFINRRDEPDVKYIISNCDVPAAEHVAIYKCRWAIESFFKFCKQSLGLNDNRSHSLKNLLSNVFHVFSLYIKLQLHAMKMGFFSIYEPLDLLRHKKSRFDFLHSALDTIFSNT